MEMEVLLARDLMTITFYFGSTVSRSLASSCISHASHKLVRTLSVQMQVNDKLLIALALLLRQDKLIQCEKQKQKSAICHLSKRGK